MKKEYYKKKRNFIKKQLEKLGLFSLGLDVALTGSILAYANFGAASAKEIVIILNYITIVEVVLTGAAFLIFWYYDFNYRKHSKNSIFNRFSSKRFTNRL